MRPDRGGLPRSRGQYAENRGELRVQPRHRLGLQAARRRCSRRLHAASLSGEALLRSRNATLRRNHGQGSGEAGRRIRADTAARHGRLPAAVPRDCAHRPRDYGRARASERRDRTRRQTARKGTRLVRRPAGRLPYRHKPHRPYRVESRTGALHIRGSGNAARHRLGLSPKRQRRTDRARSPPLRFGARRSHRRYRHIQAKGRHPGPEQGVGVAARAAETAVQARAVRRRQDAARRDAIAARLQGYCGRARLV